MICIVDSGSSKADFVFINSNGSEVARTATIGLNPIFINSNKIAQSLVNNSVISNLTSHVERIHFFGAGCRSTALKSVVKEGFKIVFKKAKCTVDSDLMAACYAVSNHQPTLIGILGTGSNSCFFNGTKVIKETPSLGFILGDEGSGNHIGREIIKAYFAKHLPEHISDAFEKKYDLTVQELLDAVHHNPNPNKFLAKFNAFVFEHKEEDAMRNLLKYCFNEYFRFQIKPYEKYDCKEISFIGSIAFYYQDLIKEVASEHGFIVNLSIQKPIDGLIAYFTKTEKRD